MTRSVPPTVPLPSDPSYPPFDPPFTLCKVVHDFTPPNSTTTANNNNNNNNNSEDHASTANEQHVLTLTRGQLIKCYNKHETGWWDGQLQDHAQTRGWFPSNYVVQLEHSTVPALRPIRTARSRSVSPTDTRSGTAVAYSNGTRMATQLNPSSIHIINSLDHAIKLLRSAVQQNKPIHFQPSTACIISSVRTILSSTGCLTRDSTVLRQHPILAQSRKRILSALASLVNQARKASSPTLHSETEGSTGADAEREAADVNKSRTAHADSESARAAEVDEMLSRAEAVYREASQFVEQASELDVECGAIVPSPTLAPDGSPVVDTRKGSLDEIGQGVAGMGFQPSATDANMLESTSSAQSGGAGIGLGVMKADGSQSEMRSRSPSAGTSTDVLIIRDPATLLDHLSDRHDVLLSTLAAFIGHTHTHTRASQGLTHAPSSSYAQLIDLTRQVIECVRQVLVVVEGVFSNAQLVTSSNTTQMSTMNPSVEETELIEAREKLYAATTGLVDAARIASSPTPSTQGPSSSNVAPDPEAAAAEERRTLLSSATTVLRSSGDCVASVKAVVRRKWTTLSSSSSSSTSRAPGELQVVLRLSAGLTPTPIPASVSGPSNEVDATRATEQGDASSSLNPSDPSHSTEEALLTAPAMSRNTLSMLGRKASSLDCLRDMYQDHQDQRQEQGPGGDQHQSNDIVDNDDDQEAYVDAPESRRRSGTQDALKTPVLASTSTTLPPPVPVPAPAPALMARDRTLSASSSSGTTTTVTDRGGAIGEDDNGRLSEDHDAAEVIRVKKESSASTSTRSTAMSRGNSETTSASAESGTSSSVYGGYNNSSYRYSGSASGFSRTSTTNTSPRNSIQPATNVQSNVSGIASAGLTATTPLFMSRDYEPREISFNADGHVTGGTLACLVERMTLHDTTIDPTFSNTFFLTFRLFTTPLRLVDELYRRFDISAPTEPPLTPEELKMWTAQKLTPVRLRVYNFFKTWVETYWQHEQDHVVVDSVLAFCRGRLASTMPASASTRLYDLVQKRVVAAAAAAGAGATGLAPASTLSSPPSAISQSAPVLQQHRGLTRMQSTERFRAGKILPNVATLYSSASSSVSSAGTSSGGAAPPAPILTRNLLAQLRSTPSSINIADIDVVELARQLTIMESRVYCAIKAEELLGMEFSKKGSNVAVNVRAMSTLSTRLTGWVSETILGEQDTKRRTGLLKYFIKLCDRCLALNNYNTLFALLAALNSSTISRLKKTWDGLPPKYRSLLESLRKATEHSRNYAEYRQKIRSAVPPCLPFVGLFLTDLTMCSEGNPPERPSPGDPSLQLINFDRYQKLARIIGDLQRFQVAYNLLEVSELQAFLNRCLESLTHGGDATSLYRQSLLVEPKDPHLAAPSINSVSSRSGGGNGGGGDFLNWRA